MVRLLVVLLVISLVASLAVFALAHAGTVVLLAVGAAGYALWRRRHDG